MCKKQTSVSHSSTEAEIISLDAGLHMDGIPALTLWDMVMEVFDTYRTEQVDPREIHGEFRREQSSSFVQHQPFQISQLRSEFQLDQLHQNDGEDARTEKRKQDRGKVKADDDEPGRLCLDKFYNSEQFDCVEKTGDTQSTLSKSLVKHMET